ncbi:MAG: RNA-binding protein [Limnochordales bacterium]|nr:RNA-binding protein [Limnochordales bacterium]
MAKTLYVGNLAWRTTEQTLTEFFSNYTQVLSARIISDRETGRSRGFGFVEVPDEDAERVISEVNGQELDGRPLNVKEAQPRPQPAGRGPRERRF